MFRNYLTTAIRNLMRNKLYAGINIIGLAVGIACFILIILFIRDERSYDAYHSKSDRIYRITEKIDLEGQGENSSSNPFPTGPTLINDYPHLIEEAVRFCNLQVDFVTMSIDEKKFAQSGVFFADSNVFKVFDFKLEKGNASKALEGPNSIVISGKMARNYFGEDDPIGKEIKYEGGLPLMVTGILEEIPVQSHFQFEALISFSTLKSMIGGGLTQNWVWNPNWTYLLLKEGVTPDELMSQFPFFIEKYYPDFMKAQISHDLQPLKSIHLHSHLDYEIEPNNKASNIYIFGLIGLFILLIACINFMNLATARSARRAREVGVRKVLGANRSLLVWQFLGESFLMSVIAMTLAIGLVGLFLPIFNNLADKSIELGSLFDPGIVLGLLSTVIFVGIVAGLYPAFYLSSFKPVTVMKGRLRSDRGNANFRKTLVVVQFTISLMLIAGTAVIYNQFVYLQSADPGFQKDHILVIPTKRQMITKIEVFKEGLKRNRKIESVSTMNEVIGTHHNVHEYNYKGMKKGEWIYFPSLIVDEDFLTTMSIPIVAGRDFSRDFPRDDSLAILVNEAMVRHMGWDSPEEAIGQQFYTPRGDEKIVGVYKDFNAVSLVDPIRPFVLDIAGGGAQFFFTKNIVVRVQPGDIDETLAHMEKEWAKVAPAHPFEYAFLDQKIESLYDDQDRLAELIGYFAILAILIACLGLFALASFTAEQRTKEIGIRKVLGANVSEIATLLAKDFIILVLVASLVACPLAWFFLSQWLQNFAYHIDMPWWVFVGSGIGVLLLALATVISQAIRAGLTNPILALREE